MSDEELFELTEWDVPENPDLVDRLASIRASEEGAQRAFKNARPELVRAAENAVDELDATKAVWTLDDVWIILKDVIRPGEERRFLGSVVRQKKKQLRFRELHVGKSARVAAHHGHMNVYLSSMNRDWSTVSGLYAEKAKKVAKIWDAQKAMKAFPTVENQKNLDRAHIEHSQWMMAVDGLEEDAPVA